MSAYGVGEELAELLPFLRVAVGRPALAQLADREAVQLLLGRAVHCGRPGGSWIGGAVSDPSVGRRMGQHSALVLVRVGNGGCRTAGEDAAAGDPDSRATVPVGRRGDSPQGVFWRGISVQVAGVVGEVCRVGVVERGKGRGPTPNRLRFDESETPSERRYSPRMDPRALSGGSGSAVSDASRRPPPPPKLGPPASGARPTLGSFPRVQTPGSASFKSQTFFRSSIGVLVRAAKESGSGARRDKVGAAA